MASKRRYAVQFVWLAKDDQSHTGMLIEQLRYAGILSVVREEEAESGDGVMVLLRLYCPGTVASSETWAQQNAARMQTFGVNAIAVPVE